MKVFLLVLICFCATYIVNAQTQTINIYDDVTKDDLNGVFSSSDMLSNQSIDGSIVNYVGNSISMGFPNEKSAIKFALSSATGTISSAVLKIYVKDVTGSPVLNLISTTDDSWSESAQTFPVYTASNIINSYSNYSSIIATSWNQLTVTNYVQSRINAGSSYISFVLTGSAAGENEFNFVAKNNSNSAYYPQLVVTYAVPATQTSSVVLSSTAPGTQLNISWTSGNGIKRAVFMKQGTGTITNPSNNTTYTASSNWNSKGTQLGTSGYYCIYNGSSNNVSVTNILPNTQYTVQVFDYNGAAGSETYNTNSASGNPSNQSTLPVELSSFTALPKDNSIQLSWTTASEINNYGFEIERSGSNSAGWEKIGFVQGNGNSNSSHSYSFTDENPISGKVQYRIKQIDNDNQFKYYDAVSIEVNAPKEFKLLQNTPNPFNPSTAIKFQLPVNSMVTVKIYDQIGREITTLVNEAKPAGSHIIYWNGRDNNGQTVASGIYLYRLTAGNYVETKKMNLLK